MDEVSFESVKCRVVTEFGIGIPMILLHGYSFTSDIWSDINLLGFLRSKHIPYLMLDMPYGLKSRCSKKIMDPVFNIKLVNHTFNIYNFTDNPLLIGASLGGYIALRYALEYPVSGLMLIAPVRTSGEEFKKLCNMEVPILIIYGTKDNIVDLDELRSFTKALRNSRLKIYENARHPAYLDYPELFKDDLYSFYKMIK